MEKLKDPAWLAEARRHIGLAEIPGKQHNPTIIRWYQNLKSWINDDETPWCGTFVAECCRVAGRDLPQHWYRARAWLDTGLRLNKPAYGCIVVFERGAGGHVGFLVGQDHAGNLMILGGNQGNKVSVAKFSPHRVLGYIWPAKDGITRLPEEERYNVPRLSLAGDFSRNEA